MLRNNKPTNCMKSNAHRFVLLTVDKHTHYMVFFFFSERTANSMDLIGPRLALLSSLISDSIGVSSLSLYPLHSTHSASATFQHHSPLMLKSNIRAYFAPKSQWSDESHFMCTASHFISGNSNFFLFGFQVHSTIVRSRRCEFFHIARHTEVSVEVGNLSTLHAVLISFWYGIYVIHFCLFRRRFTLIYVSEHLQWCTAVLRLITQISSPAVETNSN